MDYLETRVSGLLDETIDVTASLAVLSLLALFVNFFTDLGPAKIIEVGSGQLQ